MGSKPNSNGEKLKQEKAYYLSVVVPVYNEEKNLQPLTQKLKEVLNELDKDYEIIYIDDGSTDQSLSKLQTIAEKEERIKVIQFRGNFGQTAALSAGFDHARGEVVIPMDADLQNDPKDIPKLLDKIDEGFDIVSGWRKNRKDPLFTKKIPSIISNKLASKLTGVQLHDFGCTLKAYKKEVLDQIQLYGELHRYIPALASRTGVKIAEVVVQHHPRKAGKTKYGLGRLIRGFLDLVNVNLLLSYSTGPMQLFGKLGVASFGLGFLSVGAVIGMKLVMGMRMTGNPFLYLAILFVVVSVQFISLGFLAEINIRTYHESQEREIYKIRKIIN